jgi:hypothetical protein
VRSAFEPAHLAAELGDARGTQHQREQDASDRADQQRQGEGSAGGHPEEGDLNAPGVLHREDDQCDAADALVSDGAGVVVSGVWSGIGAMRRR